MTIGSNPRQSLADELVSTHFATRGPNLVIGGIDVRELVSSYGSPLFVYDANIMRRSYRRLARALEGFCEIHFSIKANPNPEIARLFVREGAGLEIASAGELELAIRASCQPKDMLFAGPGKGEAELDAAIEAGIGEIHLESMEELHTCARVAAARNRTVDVAIRINPGAKVQGGAMRMGGKPAAFGFDEEELPSIVHAVLQQDRLNLSGVHLFAGTQILDAGTLLAQWAHAIELAGHVTTLTQRPLRTLDFGGGLGVPYHTGDAPLDLEALASGLPALRQHRARFERLSATRLLVEPGRFLTAEGGVYLATVRAQKMSRGTRFIITDGGMHHHLAASGNLGQIVKRDYPLVAATRLTQAEKTPAMVTGPLCTPLDTIGRQTAFPDMKQGDLVAVLQSGAYGLSASPVGFLSHTLPAEVLVDEGRARLIRPRMKPPTLNFDVV
jgi:diaminopimelate decarboxylase